MLIKNTPVLRIVNSMCQELPQGAEMPLKVAIDIIHSLNVTSSNNGFKAVTYQIYYSLDKEIKTYQGTYRIGYEIQNFLGSIITAENKKIEDYKTYGQVLSKHISKEQMENEIRKSRYLIDVAIPYWQSCIDGKKTDKGDLYGKAI